MLSKIQMDLANSAVVRALADRDLLHKNILDMFPAYPGGARNARSLMGVLFRVEAPVILLQSQISPTQARMPAGYKITASKDISSTYLSIRGGAEYRFRLEANVAYRNGDGKRHGIKEDEGQERWLLRRAERGGFEVLDYSAEELPLIRARRGQFFAMRFDGVLKVKTLEPFIESLNSGIGQGKVYGLGLLSLAK